MMMHFFIDFAIDVHLLSIKMMDHTKIFAFPRAQRCQKIQFLVEKIEKRLTKRP